MDESGNRRNITVNAEVELWVERRKIGRQTCFAGQGPARSSLELSRAPAPMQELLTGREDQLVCQQPDRNDDQHDAYDLIHGVEFAAVVQQMT